MTKDILGETGVRLLMRKARSSLMKPLCFTCLVTLILSSCGQPNSPSTTTGQTDNAVSSTTPGNGSTSSASGATSAPTDGPNKVTITFDGVAFVPSVNEFNVMYQGGFDGNSIVLQDNTPGSQQEDVGYKGFSLRISFKSIVKEGFTESDVSSFEIEANVLKEKPKPGKATEGESWHAFIINGASKGNEVKFTNTTGRLVGTAKCTVGYRPSTFAKSETKQALITFDVAFPKKS